MLGPVMTRDGEGEARGEARERVRGREGASGRGRGGMREEAGEEALLHHMSCHEQGHQTYVTVMVQDTCLTFRHRSAPNYELVDAHKYTHTKTHTRAYRHILTH